MSRVGERLAKLIERVEEMKPVRVGLKDWAVRDGKVVTVRVREIAASPRLSARPAPSAIELGAPNTTTPRDPQTEDQCEEQLAPGRGAR